MLALCLTMVSTGIFAQRRTFDVKDAKFSKEDFAKLKGVLKGADPSTYSVQYIVNGRVVDKMGSASFSRLSTVAIYHSPGSLSAINEVVTTISNYVKTVLTSKFNEAYPEKVTAINSLLEQSAITGRFRKAQSNPQRRRSFHLFADLHRQWQTGGQSRVRQFQKPYHRWSIP